MGHSPDLSSCRPQRTPSAAMWAGLQQLHSARSYAQELLLEAWDFAVELPSLHSTGLSTSDLRWLICKGYVDHAAEVTAFGTERREFRKLGLLRLSRRTCFVLTDAGLDLLTNKSLQSSAPADNAPPRSDSPHWDDSKRELRLGDRIVKRFRVPALNQELILAAFQEERWPDYLDDPLPPLPGLDSKRRLHDAIKSLNRHQISPLLRFHGNGRGCGVHWEYLPHSFPTSSPRLP